MARDSSVDVSRFNVCEIGSISTSSAKGVIPSKQIRELQRMLGKKTMEAEVLKEAVEIARSRKWIAHSPLLPGDVSEAGQPVCSPQSNGMAESFVKTMKRDYIAHMHGRIARQRYATWRLLLSITTKSIRTAH